MVVQNSSPDIYTESVLIPTHELCMRIFKVQNMTVMGVKNPFLVKDASSLKKTIVSCQMWSVCCNSIPLFSQSDEKCCPQVLSIFMTMLGRILQLQHRGSWSIFDGKCLITHHHPPILGSLWFSSLYSYETVVGGQHFGTKSCRPAQHKELAESICGWLLWRGYLKVIVYFHSYGE